MFYGFIFSAQQAALASDQNLCSAFRLVVTIVSALQKSVEVVGLKCLTATAYHCH